MRHLVTRICAPLVLLGLGVLVSCTTVPITGRSQVMLLSEGEEQKLGLDAYQDVLKKAKLSNDPDLNAQVTRVGRRIADVTGRTDYQWEFKVIEDKQANAFCLPGGKVAVYTGILPITRDDAGLAAVIGHEAAHAIARHGGERASQQLLAQLGQAGTQLAVSRRDPLIQQAVLAGYGGLATVGVLLPYGRAQESEADYLGLVYMAKAGYHPSAARDLWVRMAEASKGRERPPEFLSTHPAEATRIKQIEGWIPEALKHYQPRP